MKSLKFQRGFLRKIQQLGFLLMVLIPWIAALYDTEEDKTYNLKIGFDLTRGSQGASALLIRNIEGNDNAEKSTPALRARTSEGSSSSNEKQNNEKKTELPKSVIEMKAADDSAHWEDTDDSDGDKKQRSTKGIRSEDFEPQGPEVHETLDNDSESENSN